MITATFSLVQQLVNMRCLPPYDPFLTWDPVWLTRRFRLHMVHTSDKVQGQVFIPVANWIREQYYLRTTRLTLNLVFSYDSDHYYCGRL
jgi:KUP system potassium uptake protein